MKRMFLLFSHKLFPAQISDAKRTWGVEDFVALPNELQAQFSQVPTNLTSLDTYGQQILDWLMQQQITDEDYLLIQGEYGLTYWLVSHCKTNNWQVLHTTTPRKIMSEDNSFTITRQIEPQSFRYYEN